MPGVTPTPAEMHGILAGRPQGWTQRWRYGLPSWRHVSDGGFRRERYSVTEIPEALARSFIERHHYLAGWPSALHRYGLWDHEPPQGEGGPGPGGAALAGVLVLGCPMNERVLTRAFPRLAPYYESAEISRLALTDDVAANGESFFIAAALRRAAERGIRGVVSFSDPVPRSRRTPSGEMIISNGHLGIVYQSCNFRFTGRGTKRTLTLLPDGTVLTARSRAKLTSRVPEPGAAGVESRLAALGAPPRTAGESPAQWLPRALEHLGARSIRHPGNFRYVLPVGRTRAERSRTVIALEAAPYPKSIA
ncbi:hypothetical protein [Streptomyces sp. A 4/2]|uniref:Mom family adenine methylcarbamoylation protein n=1 Tax=Streptomyces sp. A 4/2 TaxID=2934314 RepID=UPI0020246225|nr:hypothetical protein [Streptomyces sp. A 4/2]